MTKVLIVATIAGTIKAFLLPFVGHFQSKGWGVDGMAQGIGNCETCGDTFDHTWEINWSRNPFDLRNLLSAPRRIRQVAAAGKFDIIHVHTPVASFVTRFALRGIPKEKRPRVIYTAHGFHFFKGGNLFSNRFYLLLEKLAGTWTDYLVVMNAEDLDAARRFGIMPDDRIRFMPGIGVDTSEFRAADTALPAATERIRLELGLSDRACIFLMVAEFISRKRHVDAVHALALLKRPDVHLVFAGRGPTESQIRTLGQKLGISNRLHFLGFRRDIADLMLASNAVVLPSKHEGLPRSLMEALCLGVPCIGSDIRGTRDLLENGCGLLFPPRDVISLAMAMEKVLDAPDEVARMAEKGREKMKGYDVNVIISLHENLYEQALAS